MKLHCLLEPNDYVQAQYLHMKPRSVFKWLGLLVALLAFGTSIASIFLSPKFSISAYAVIGAGIAYLFMLAVWIPTKTKKVFKQQKLLHEPYESILNEEGFSTTSSYGSATLAWKDFHKYRLGKTLVLIYQSDALYHMFPKRWFSEEEFKLFLSYLHQSLGDPK